MYCLSSLTCSGLYLLYSALQFLLKCCNVQLFFLLFIDSEPDPDPDADANPETDLDDEIHRAISGVYTEPCMSRVVYSRTYAKCSPKGMKVP